MSMTFAMAEWPLRPRAESGPRIGLFYAGIIVIMAVAQLFGFEKFIPLIQHYGLPGAATGVSVACLIVIAEVFAVPFLLRMKLSPLMRIVSMVCGWLVAVTWLVLAVWATVSEVPGNMGFLGASVPLLSGWWAVFVSAALGILAGWASWGMWPVSRQSGRVRK